MRNTYRFTGPPENWITGIGLKKWAVNNFNKLLWDKLQPGDIALLHSSISTVYSNRTVSSIIGYATIANAKFRKTDSSWIQEIQDNDNKWPYVFTLDKIYLFSDDLNIDFDTPLNIKSQEQIKKEVDALSQSGIRLKELQKAAKRIDAQNPQFPVNGSASSVNPVYEELLLCSSRDFFAIDSQSSNTQEIEERMASAIDQDLAAKTIPDLLKEARAFTTSGPRYTESNQPRRVRRENITQKRRIAKIENYSCQVCNFKCEYRNHKNVLNRIIDVDHIIPVELEGTDDASNLWALCPNCHRKKTAGVIKVDLAAKKVFENGDQIEIIDNHLFIE